MISDTEIKLKGEQILAEYLEGCPRIESLLRKS